jgi:hypothetical protein
MQAHQALDDLGGTLAFAEPVGGAWASHRFGVVAELLDPDVCF